MEERQWGGLNSVERGGKVVGGTKPPISSLTYACPPYVSFYSLSESWEIR